MLISVNYNNPAMVEIKGFLKALTSYLNLKYINTGNKKKTCSLSGFSRSLNIKGFVTSYISTFPSTFHKICTTSWNQKDMCGYIFSYFSIQWFGWKFGLRRVFKWKGNCLRAKRNKLQLWLCKSTLAFYEFRKDAQWGTKYTVARKSYYKSKYTSKCVISAEEISL